mgnify:CR=1 FL=1
MGRNSPPNFDNVIKTHSPRVSVTSSQRRKRNERIQKPAESNFQAKEAVLCPFCDMDRPEFSESEEKLDIHYATACLMLAECRQCLLMIEVHKYSSHLLN